MGLIKKKTAWYVILRALREKVSTFNSSTCSSTSMPDRLSQIASRIKEIQSWLGFSDEFAEGWIKISTAFAKSVVADKSINGNDIRTRFPTVFENFLRDDPDCNKIYETLTEAF
ncbi:unnamed protein product [Orchesella dallaii]|uniref:Uncharacterized protein n=1 Tax=Orchesella dallaii TaxID=48710 RepID=A0ABP1QGV8_9HEXA